MGTQVQAELAIMKPIQILREAKSRSLIDEDGDEIEVSLLPGLGEIGLKEFEDSLPCTLPEEVRELLLLTRGFEGAVADQVDFTGSDLEFELKRVFPHGVPIAADGFGNFWVVDLTPESTTFGPIWFACHDAPVILYQSRDLSEFLVELFKACQPPHESLINDVHEDRIQNVWRTNPGVSTFEACVESSDSVLREFASALDPSFQIIDLRSAQPGDGFSWGRYGPNTVVRRHGLHPVFAYQRKVGFLQKIFRG